MLLIYTIIYFLSIVFYYMKLNYIASVTMISLAIFLYVCEMKRLGHIINVRGLFALGFIGGFGLSLLKLSKLSNNYNIITFIVVYVSYFSIYFGSFLYNKKHSDDDLANKKNIAYKKETLLTNQNKLMIILFILTFASFIVEVVILKFIPLFTTDTPHAYSTFHVFMLHYITTFYIFLPSIAICNYLTSYRTKADVVFIVLSYLYVIAMATLMVSRAQLIQSFVLSIFVLLIYKGKDATKVIFKKSSIILIISTIVLFLGLYFVITVNRAHDVKYLNGIFEMKNANMPIFLTQPYMYIAHNFENLNYMINNVFRLTFGRRVLYPLFTLTLIKKFFPIVVESPYYIIKEELSTVTLVYDFYYDFGIIGVALFCFIIGYVGSMIEDKAYNKTTEETVVNNNYVVIICAQFCYYMFFSFFQAYFSLTDTWVYLIILTLLSLFFKMSKNSNKKREKKINKYDGAIDIVSENNT